MTKDNVKDWILLTIYYAKVHILTTDVGYMSSENPLFYVKIFFFFGGFLMCKII